MKDYRVLNVNDNLVSAYNKGYEQGYHDTLVDIARGKDAIPIPDGATNGDVIREIWHDETLLSNIEYCYGEEWLNAPYKGGKE